jgi:predicted PurR-regulated permease PerM
MSEKTSSFLRSPLENNLLLIVLLIMLVALYHVLKIFFGIFTFALIFYVSFFKAFEYFTVLLKGRRKLAGVLYSVLFIVLMAVPFIFMITALGKHIKDVEHFVVEVKTKGVPPLPKNITELPYAGQGISNFWLQLQQNPKEIVLGHEHQIKNGLHYLLTGGLGLAGTGLQVIFGIVVSAIFLVGGKDKLIPIKSALAHLLGRKDGLLLLNSINNAIKGVSVGVIGTAFLTAVFSWIGFAIAGIHFKFLLTAIVFVLVLIQIGPMLVWLPVIIWVATQGQTGTTIFLLLYAVFMWVAESLVRPVLIAKSGGKLPFIVLFIGVIGGLTAWGFIGMFKGAIITSIMYTVFHSWLENKEKMKAVDSQINSD